MAEPISAGTRVEIKFRLLESAERAPLLPPDTAALPYEVRVRGRLLADAMLGDDAEVRTQAGRVLAGKLVVVEPADSHTFGRPHPALLRAIDAITDLKGAA
jgi:hypothetical protein